MPRRGTRHGPVRFRTRREAGQQLAEVLARRWLTTPVVLALPRGGVPVAAEIAARLHAPLDVLIVRKLGCPGRRELGVGAVAEGGVQLRNERLIAKLGLTPEELDPVVSSERAEVERRARRYRGDRPAADVRGRTVIVVDDGLATGFTARAAIDVVRLRDAATAVLAVPVAPVRAVEELREVADDVVCLQTPTSFVAIGQWYDDFTQVGDDEVTALLDRHHPPHTPDAAGRRAPPR